VTPGGTDRHDRAGIGVMSPFSSVSSSSPLSGCVAHLSGREQVLLSGVAVFALVLAIGAALLVAFTAAGGDAGYDHA
jgi:hypothetical protein